VILKQWVGESRIMNSGASRRMISV
jgi:hypothetical protein